MTARRRERTSRRKAGGPSTSVATPPAPAYVKRQIPFLEYLDEEGLVRLEEQADWLIEEIGMEFR
ncbi:MAG: trimethylamine methyltransferase family protein, partial [Hyphomicrobiaceae bacterium]